MFLARQRGFTLIELLMVVAIIGILASVAVPRYRVYSNKARFIEGTMTLAPHRNGVLIATSGGRVDALNELDAGIFGIPPTQTVAASTHGVDVVDGVITFTWQSDGTPLAGQTYVLTPDGIVPPIQWAGTGSCFANDFC